MTSFTVKDIAKLMKDSKKSRKPFVFFTGAGCSKSADIPLAFELVAEINKKHKTALKELTIEQKKDYGACMGALGKAERRALIQAHIKKSKINWAHIALACMLEAGYISRVLTFNFDNLLARASSLIGLYPATYDFTSANLDLHHLIVEPALVHLHGQGEGFIQLNTEKETYDHAEKLSNFIAATLNSSPSLFIGYSGGADAFFPLLKEKFKGEYRLVWTSYSDKPSKLVGDFLEANKNLTHFIGEQDADLFLIDLANELRCFPPSLFENPYKHLLKVLENVQPFPTKIKDSSINFFDEVKTHLLKISEDASEIRTLKFKKLLMSGKYNELINYYKRMEKEGFGLADKEIIAWAYTLQGDYLSKIKNNQALVNYESALSFYPNFYPALNNAAFDYINLARWTCKEDMFKKAIEYLELALKEKKDDSLILNNYAAALLGLGRLNSDKELIEKSLNLFSKLLDEQQDSTMFLTNYGNAIAEIGFINKDASYVFLAIEKFKESLKFDSRNPETLNNYGVSLLKLADLTRDSSFYYESIEKFKEALDIRSDYASALCNYAVALNSLGRIENDIDFLNKSCDIYKEALYVNSNAWFLICGYGGSLLRLAEMTKDKKMLEKSYSYLKKAEKLGHKEVYELACYYSVIGNFLLCKNNLLLCESKKSFPCFYPKKYMESDVLLNNVRNLDWFQELLARLPD